MPLPLILGIAAAVAGTTGVGLGIHGGVKMKQANDKLKEAQKRNNSNNARLERMNQSACRTMDVLGENEMKVLSEFQQFSDLFERIKNRPEFADVKIGNVFTCKKLLMTKRNCPFVLRVSTLLLIKC